MSEINLQSVLDRLLKEDNEQATAILHQWFVEKCANINRGLLGEEVHVHVHQGANDHVSEDDDEENPTLRTPDDVTPRPIDPAPQTTAVTPDAVTPRPISGDDEVEEDFDDDGEMSPEGDDLDIEPDMDMNGEENSDEVELEDKVDDLQAELDDLKQKMIDQLGLEIDDDEDAMDADSEVDGDTEDDDSDLDDEEGDEDSEDEEEDTEEDPDSDDDDDENEDEKNPFEDLEESFELERVPDPHLDGSSTIGSEKTKFTKNDKSLIPGNTNIDGRVGGKPVVIHSDNYTKNGLQPSPSVKDVPLRKNQVKNANSDLERVDSTGPKNALLNRKGDGYSSDTNDKSLIGSKGSVGNNKGFR